MAHINYSKTAASRRTPAEWLKVSANIAKVANDWANRHDIVAYIGENAGEGLAPALFKPAIAEIEVDRDLAFGFGVKPEQIGDLAEADTRYEFPKATGLILHEAFHARFSVWDMDAMAAALNKKEQDAFILLEESRIEAQGLKTNSSHRNFLRACVLELVISDMGAMNLADAKVADLSRLVALLHGRIVAGVLGYDDILAVADQIKDLVGKDNLDKLMQIAGDFHNQTNYMNPESAYQLARDWVKVFDDLAAERGEEQEGEGEGEGEGSGAGEGEGEGELSKAMSELMDALREAAEDMAIANAGELADQEQDEEWEQEVKEKASKAKQQNKHQEIAAQVFGKRTDDSEKESFGATHSTVVDKRKPTGSERQAAVIVSRLLEKAKYRERSATELKSILPPGKLRPAALIQAAAQKSKGAMVTAEPWSRTVRKHTDDPTLTVGVMVDISGSMNRAMQPMATTAWVMSEAVRRVQGKAAMVYYGNSVFPTLRKGQHLDEVTVFHAGDSTEKFDTAFKALDGELNLLYGTGARLLVVVSDGEYTRDETAKAAAWVKECERNGVAILWLPFDDGYTASRLTKGTNAVVVSGRGIDPTTAATEIGKAAATALERMTVKNAA